MVVAAFLNAAASVLQRRAARDEPESAGFSIRMLWDLVRRPVWALGVATMIAGFLLHAVSISLSRISLVQPLLVSELPFTLLLAAWAFGVRLPRAVLGAILLQSAGLAAFVSTLSPTGGNAAAVAPGTWALGVGLTCAVVVVLVVLGYLGRREHRAAALGAATGIVFGLNSSLIAGVGASVAHGAGLFAVWQTYAVAVVAPVSFFLLQNSLQAGNLAASQPGFTLLNPLTSVCWGLAVFGEQARHGPFLAGAVLGALAIAAGTWWLARSPLLDPNATPEQRYGSARFSGEAGG